MKKHPTVVIKLGTSSIVQETTHQPLLSILAIIVETAVSLRQNGYKVVIVSSGAIGIALQQMDLPRRPKKLSEVQALAAIGQCRLMGLWDQLFSRLGQNIAQILLTRGDFADRTQYLNAQNTMHELLSMGVIPIVNENDTIAVSEIKFGDNDTLSAITAAMVGADYLFLMTDVDCLYDSNPRANPNAKAIEVVENISELEADVSSAGSDLGTGGMSTKIVAAKRATAAGVTTVITRSSKPGNIAEIVRLIEAEKEHKRRSAIGTPNGTLTPTTEQSVELAATNTPMLPSAPLHTRFLPSPKPVRDRQFWILHSLKPHGTLYIDQGAARALEQHHAGLFPVGIVDLEGSFSQQECVRVVEVERIRHQQPLQATCSPSSSQELPPPQQETPLPPLHPVRAVSAHADSPWTSPLVQPGAAISASPYFNSAHTREIGRAIVNYSSVEIRLIAGLKSTEIEGVLGYADSEYVVPRESFALLGAGLPPSRPASRPVTPTRSLSGFAGKQATGVGGLGSYVES